MLSKPFIARIKKYKKRNIRIMAVTRDYRSRTNVGEEAGIKSQIGFTAKVRVCEADTRWK